MSVPNDTPQLVLMQLQHGCPALTEACGRSLAEAAAVCLQSEGHSRSALLRVIGNYTSFFTLISPSVTEQMLRCYNDIDEAVEKGACGIAILLIRELAGYAAVMQSRKGTGFDYWLGTQEDPNPFQARLEVSGIRKGSPREVSDRVQRKCRQTKQSDDLGLPAYVAVVEFGRPMAQVTNR